MISANPDLELGTRLGASLMGAKRQIGQNYRLPHGLSCGKRFGHHYLHNPLGGPQIYRLLLHIQCRDKENCEGGPQPVAEAATKFFVMEV